MYEMKKGACYGIRFIDPNTINEYTWKIDLYHEKSVEESMLQFFKELKYNEDIYYFLTTSSESHCLVLQILCFCLLASYMFLLTYARLIKTCKRVCM